MLDNTGKCGTIFPGIVGAVTWCSGSGSPTCGIKWDSLWFSPKALTLSWPQYRSRPPARWYGYRDPRLWECSLQVLTHAAGPGSVFCRVGPRRVAGPRRRRRCRQYRGCPRGWLCWWQLQWPSAYTWHPSVFRMVRPCQNSMPRASWCPARANRQGIHVVACNRAWGRLTTDDNPGPVGE